MDCLFCYGHELGEDLHPEGEREFDVSICHAPCQSPLCCLAGCLCGPCAQCNLRLKALDGNIKKYTCCMDATTCTSSKHCPWLCLCMEVTCCTECAQEATYHFVMEDRNIRTSPCERRLTRLQNCLAVRNARPRCRTRVLPGSCRERAPTGACNECSAIQMAPHQGPPWHGVRWCLCVCSARSQCVAYLLKKCGGDARDIGEWVQTCAACVACAVCSCKTAQVRGTLEGWTCVARGPREGRVLCARNLKCEVADVARG